MCTVVVSIQPESPVPVLLAGIRDEFHDRRWTPPARHWPDRPALIGGQDLLAGGTWLAADPAVPRVGCVLNGRGPLAPDAKRLSRGDLPLRFAADGALDHLEFDRYDPFHLVCADLREVRLLSWNGSETAEQALAAGLHIIVNSGLEGADPTPGPGSAEMDARIAHFRPRLAAAHRPEPAADGTTDQAWGQWLPLIDGDGLPDTDDRALLVRREIAEGRVWGTTSVTLVGLRPGGLRYDFTAARGVAADARNWWTVVR